MMLREIYNVFIPKNSQKSRSGRRDDSKKEVTTRFETEMVESAETSSGTLIQKKNPPSP